MSRSRAGAAPSGQSWVYPYNQNTAPLPAPPPLNLSSPVDERLPNPYPSRQRNHGRSGLRVVNNAPEVEEHKVEDDIPVDTSSFEADLGYRPQTKKKSLMGRMFKGVGRIPEVLGYGVGAGLQDKRKMNIVNLDDDYGYGSSTLTRTDTLPQYNSQSSHSHHDPPQSTLGLNFHPQHYPADMTIQEYPDLEHSQTPPPDVVRLSDTTPSALPLKASLSRRVPPPSVDVPEEDVYVPGALFSGSHFIDHQEMEGSGTIDPVERTTVMVYDRDSRYPDPAPVPFTPPAPPSRPISSGPGLSYATPEPLPTAPLRPMRPISVAAPPPPPVPAPAPAPPAPINTNVGTPITAPSAKRLSKRLSKRTPTGPRPLSIITTPFEPNPPAPPVPASVPTTVSAPAPTSNVVSAPMFPEVMVPTTPAPVRRRISAPKLEDIMSPVSAKPGPADDYMKMTRSPSSHHTGTASSPTTFSQDPSFTSELSPFVRFVRTLYHMPWISHDRVTVDYLPNEGVIGLRQKATRKKAKPMPWYNASGQRTRRDSALGLLSDGHSKHTDTKRHASSGAYMRTRRRHHHHHHSSPSKRHHHKHDSRRQTGSTDNVPLPHASPMYPFPYSPFPYAPYPGFPLPAIAPGQTPPKGMEAQSAAAASPHGYPPYQMYFLAQSPHAGLPQGQGAPPIPAVLVPGVVDTEHASHNASSPAKAVRASTSGVPPVLVPGAVDEEHKEAPRLSTMEPSQKTSRQSIPGAFA